MVSGFTSSSALKTMQWSPLDSLGNPGSNGSVMIM